MPLGAIAVQPCEDDAAEDRYEQTSALGKRVCVEFCSFDDIGEPDAQRWLKWPFSKAIKMQSRTEPPKTVTVPKLGA